MSKYVEGSLYDYASESIKTILEADDFKAVEGLNSNIFGKAFVAIIDTFAGVALTFKSNILNITKSIKRSELHEFRDSNRVKLNVVDKIDYSKLVGFKIDVPANLNDTYVQVIKSLADLYTKLNTSNNAKLMLSALNEIFNSVTTAKNTTGSIIDKYSRIVSVTVNAAKVPMESFNSQFNGKFEKQLPFEEVFLTKKEWYDSLFMLLDLEPRLQEARGIKETVESMEGVLKSICEFGQGNPDGVTKDNLMKLGEMVKNIALIMDGYHVAVVRQLALEHNYVLMTNSIFSNVK